MIDPDDLLQAYRLGVFPMALEDGDIGWFSPDPRTIIPLEGFHVPHGLRRERQRQKFEVRIDTAFEEVMRACAEREDTWINEEIIASYVRLHELGFAHSVETVEECRAETDRHASIYRAAGMPEADDRARRVLRARAPLEGELCWWRN